MLIPFTNGFASLIRVPPWFKWNLTHHLAWALKENKSNAQKSSKSLLVLHEVEIVNQGPKLPLPVRITNSNECYNVLLELYDKRKIDYKEMFFVLLLNKANYCLGASKIELGSTSVVQVIV